MKIIKSLFWGLVVLFITGFPVSFAYHFPKFTIIPLLVVVVLYGYSWKYYSDIDDRILKWGMVCIGLMLSETALILMVGMNFEVANKPLSWGIFSGTILLCGIGLLIIWKNLPVLHRGFLWERIIANLGGVLNKLFDFVGILLLSAIVLSIPTFLPLVFAFPTLLAIVLYILSWQHYPDDIWVKAWNWGAISLGLLFVEGSGYILYNIFSMPFDIGSIIFGFFLVLVFGAGLKILWSNLPVLHHFFRILFEKIKPGPNQEKVLEQLKQHQNLSSSEDIKAFEKAFEALDIKKLNDEDLNRYHHLYGICAFRCSDHEVAKERFKKGLQDCPDSAAITFSLAQEYIFLNQPDKAFPLFDKCVYPNVPSSFILTMSRYAYLHGEHDRGIDYLIPIFNHYDELKILDDTFVKMRELPFFEETWGHLAAHCTLYEGSSYIDLLYDMTEHTMEVCHDYDFDLLKLEMMAAVTKNYDELIEPIKQIRDSRKNDGLSTGYEDLKIAIFESFKLKSFDEACERIGRVTLTDNGFPWLKDIRTLAFAEAAYRFDNEDECIWQTRAFLVQQSMLFEPNIALDFGLLGYQEKIKDLAEIPKFPSWDSAEELLKSIKTALWG